MNDMFFFSFALIFFSLVTNASKVTLQTKYSDPQKNRLYGLLTRSDDDYSMEMDVLPTTTFVCNIENIVATREILKDTNLTPLDLYSLLTKSLLPTFHTKLVVDYYKEQRSLKSIPDEFDEFDAQFCCRLHIIQELKARSRWGKLEGLSSKEEVICEATYFYNLIDFERTITCLDMTPPTPLTCKMLSTFVADMYFGEMKRSDFVYEDDIEGRKWLDEMLKKYNGGHNFHAASLMRRFTRNIRDKVDDGLWSNYMRAMMTVHLSAAFIWINIDGLRGMYEYLVDNRIQEEFMFSSIFLNPTQPGQKENESHTFLRTFKLDANGTTATMGIINSGDGLQFHDRASFKLGELPDTISEHPHHDSSIRFVPFVAYDAVPRSEWTPAYAVSDTIEVAYFEKKQKRHNFGTYQRWQYVDYQRAGTCSAMSLWNALYWFEQKNQRILETFKLILHLEFLKEAAREIAKLRAELERLEVEKFASVDIEPKRVKLQSTIKKMSDIEDDALRFFSIGFNSAIRSLRFLQLGPFSSRLNMTTVMQHYTAFYNSQKDMPYWQLVKPNIDDLYNSTHDRVLMPTTLLTTPLTPKIPMRERECVSYVRHAFKSKDPFDFVKAVISGTSRKCYGETFLAMIIFGVDKFDMQIHHQDLILRTLIKEARLLHGRKQSIFRLIERLIADYGFKLFPKYKLLPTRRLNFSNNVDQIFWLDNDLEVEQFVTNCNAFESPAQNLLMTTYNLVKAKKKMHPRNLEMTEEYKTHVRFIHHISIELKLSSPRLYTQHLSQLIANTEQIDITSHIDYFPPSEEWNQDDYALLEHAIQGDGADKNLIQTYINYCKLDPSRDVSSESSPVIITDDLSVEEYVNVGNVKRAIKANSSLDFVKAIVSGVKRGYKSDLFFLSITLGIRALDLHNYHQDSILRALIAHKNEPLSIWIIDRLIVNHGFKLFPIDDTPTTKKNYSLNEFFLKVPLLKDDTEAQQFAINCNRTLPNATRLLFKLAHSKDSRRARFIDYILMELQTMEHHLYAYHLGRFINQNILRLEDFVSAGFKPPDEWTHYDYILIDYAIPKYQLIEFDKIFNFPKEYQISTKNVASASKFDQMDLNPSPKVLEEYAILLFNKGRLYYRSA